MLWATCLCFSFYVIVEDNDRSTRALAGAIFVILALVGVIWFAFSITEINRTTVIECEKDLPRTLKCVLIAVPEEIKGE
jgi:hypothetical protein